MRWFFEKKERDKRPSLFSIYGKDYFIKIDEAIRDSPTASQAVNLMADYVAGAPQEDINVGGEKLNDIIDWAARQIAKYRGFVIHFDINGELKPTRLDLRDFKNYTLVEGDSNGETAVIRRITESGTIDYFKYSNDPRVIAEQIEKEGGINKHKGYVMYFPFEKTDSYPTPFIHPSLPLAMAEKASGLLKFNALKKGTFNNTFIITGKFADRTEKENFINTIKIGMGEEGVNGITVLEAEKEGDKIEDEFILKEINSGFDSKTLEYTDSQAQQKIASCFKNIPIDLISQNSGMFQGGEKITEMRNFYNEQTEKERKKLESCINEILNIFEMKPIVINPITKIGNNEQNTNDTAIKAI